MGSSRKPWSESSDEKGDPDAMMRDDPPDKPNERVRVDLGTPLLQPETRASVAPTSVRDRVIVRSYQMTPGEPRYFSQISTLFGQHADIQLSSGQICYEAGH